VPIRPSAKSLLQRAPTFEEMGKRHRQSAAGFHHVFARGNNRRAIFRDDLDREDFLARLERVVYSHGWLCHIFCLLTNHFHLLVETLDGSLPKGMQRLNLTTAQSFNRRYGTIGHLFQGPYGSEPVTRDGHARYLVRYIAMNPVEAGLCRVPDEWRWSSYGATVGLRKAPAFLTTSWVLGLFGDDPAVSRRRLRSFVNGTRSR
jgi:putative transposase